MSSRLHLHSKWWAPSSRSFPERELKSVWFQNPSPDPHTTILSLCFGCFHYVREAFWATLIFPLVLLFQSDVLFLPQGSKKDQIHGAVSSPGREDAHGCFIGFLGLLSEVPQARRFQTAENLSHNSGGWTFEIGASGRLVPSGGSEGRCVSLLTSGGCQRSLAFLGLCSLTPISASAIHGVLNVPVCNFPFSFKDTSRIALVWPILLLLNLMTSAKTRLPNKVTFIGTRG